MSREDDLLREAGLLALESRLALAVDADDLAAVLREWRADGHAFATIQLAARTAWRATGIEDDPFVTQPTFESMMRQLGDAVRGEGRPLRDVLAMKGRHWLQALALAAEAELKP